MARSQSPKHGEDGHSRSRPAERKKMDDEKKGASRDAKEPQPSWALGMQTMLIEMRNMMSAMSTKLDSATSLAQEAKDESKAAHVAALAAQSDAAAAGAEIASLKSEVEALKETGIQKIVSETLHREFPLLSGAKGKSRDRSWASPPAGASKWFASGVGQPERRTLSTSVVFPEFPSGH